MITRCANSACRTSFDYHVGGKFFRFHLTETEPSVFLGVTHNLHNVVHYWLCPTCSKMFTLVHVDTGNIVLRPARQGSEEAGSQHQFQLTAA